METKSIDQKFRTLLQLNWLRPERAIMKLFKTVSLEGVVFRSPSLDLSCGDGSLMFVHFGGEFEFEFDDFLNTRAREFKHGKFVDIFDCENDIKAPIKRKPNFIVDYGTDWKDALLSKAHHLGAHKKMICHDNNVMPLPFETDFFQTVFSNAIYWVDDVEAVLKDIHRILKPGGEVILQLMTPHFLGTLDRLESVLSPAAIDILDRNRRATMPNAKTHEEWFRLVENSGFSLNRSETMFPTETLIDIWNVGMRPISHLLIQMTEELSPKRRLEIKSEWVDIFYELLFPLVTGSNTCPIERSPYLLVVAQK